MTMQIFVTTTMTGRVEVSERAGSWRFNALLPGGWWQASVQLSAPERDLWQLVDAWPGGTLEFYDRGETVWRGRLAGAGLSSEGITLSAEGLAREMMDAELWRIFSDSEYGRWEPQDKVPEGFAADNNNRVYVEARDGTYVDLVECVVSYPEDTTELGDDIVQVEARAAIAINSGAWIAELRDNAGNVLWTSSVGTEKTHTLFLDGATGGTFKLGDGDAIETAALDYNDSAGDIQTALRTAYSDATITVAADADFAITFPTGGPELTITDNSLTYATTGTPTCTLIDDTEAIDEAVASAGGLVWALRKNGGGAGEASARLTYVVVRTLDPCTSSDIVTEILSDAGITGEVESSGLDVARAIYQGNSATAMRVLSEMAALGDGAEGWVLAIYDVNGDDGGAEFRAWEDTATWLLAANEARFKWTLEWKLSDIYNAVRGELPDGYRTSWYTDADSIAYFGTRREKTLRLPMTTQAEAATWAQLYLADHAWARAALRLDAGELCRKPDGSLFPATFIRAGDVITLRDMIPDRDETIRVQEASVSNGTVTIVPVGVDDRLEVLLAAREI